MPLFFSLFILTLTLSACSFGPSQPETSSGSFDASGSFTNNFTGDVQAPLVETLSGDVSEYYPIFDGLESKVVHAYHTSGTATKISFIVHEGNSMVVSLDFLEDKSPNLRLSRIVMPDGTIDGPFGKNTGYNLIQKGGYELVFNENQMAGEPWSGAVDITVTLSGGTYPENTILFE